MPVSLDISCAGGGSTFKSFLEDTFQLLHVPLAFNLAQQISQCSPYFAPSQHSQRRWQQHQESLPMSSNAPFHPSSSNRAPWHSTSPCGANPNARSKSPSHPLFSRTVRRRASARKYWQWHPKNPTRQIVKSRVSSSRRARPSWRTSLARVTIFRSTASCFWEEEERKIFQVSGMFFKRPSLY